MPKGGLSLTTRGYYLCILSSPCLNRYISLYERSSDSSFDSLSDVQAARETCCETKREIVREETSTPPVRMYMAMKRNYEEVFIQGREDVIDEIVRADYLDYGHNPPGQRPEGAKQDFRRLF